jgi:hypothetical protein
MMQHEGLVRSALTPIELGTEVIAEPWHAKWRWYKKGMDNAEKKLLFKLDFMILAFGSLTFFTKVCTQDPE